MALAQERLRIGLTAVILADQAAFLARWADYLSQRLDTRVTFVSRDQYQTVHDLLFNGQIDAAWTCGYPFVRFQSQLQLVAVPLYQGQPSYQSYLIRPLGDSTVTGWSSLAGKVFAYSDPLSNSGWLVAQGEFAKAGIGQRDLKRTFFAHGHRNVADAVASHLADAGSIDGYVWETMKLQGMAGASQTEVIWKSSLHGFPPLVAATGAASARMEALRRSLLDMQKDDAGRALLKSLNLDGFIAGQVGLFDSIRQLARSVPGSGVTT
ncbi:substrate-binding domain-containing protein [Rubrivivax albus]|uniref:substrate-binding domain-containing protein n=1 Tax=Rubrivivax albus TaxID=2499835 RepID=UPI001E32F696|nr:PhnD/SsuA/transferrin family substrate-binding protein [Rubrivivax albus]